MSPRLLRILVPLAVVLVGLMVIFSQVNRGPSSTTPDEDNNTTETTSQDSGTVVDADPSDPTTSLETKTDGDGDGAGDAAVQPPDTDDANLPALVAGDDAMAGLSVRRIESPAEFTPFETPDMVVEFSPHGAGIKQITLKEHYQSSSKSTPYKLIDGAPVARPSLAIRGVLIDGVFVAVSEFDNVWREVQPGWFEADIVNAEGAVVAAIKRVFTIGDEPGEITVNQVIENRTDGPFSVAVEQWGPCDLPYEPGGYGDFRRIRFGYLDPRDPTVVLADEFVEGRRKLLPKAQKVDDRAWRDGLASDANVLWPNELATRKNFTLSWVATTNRYFGFAVYSHIDPLTPASNKAFSDVSSVAFFVDADVERLAMLDKRDIANRFVNLKIVGSESTIEPNQAHDFSIAAYAGALDSSILGNRDPYQKFNLNELIRYELGCTWCTFQWLAHFLLWFLTIIDIVVRDWGLAIIILVLCVRSLLHPLTKKGQISMQKTTRRMSKLQPELQKIREKYADDQKRIQQETMRMYKEHNVNPAGCLGVLPMFVQMPIWVALYAMLYFAIELRQEPAFYGVFQLFGNWPFLADLSRPDRFIPLPGNFKLVFLDFSSINILPVLMGMVFYLQQKYMTPPNPNMTPEQASQQKIMKIVFPLMFPIMLYNAPSGLTLYIMTSSFIGIVESRYIRAHVDALDLEEPEPKKKKSSSSSSGNRKKVANRASGGKKKRR